MFKKANTFGEATDGLAGKATDGSAGEVEVVVAEDEDEEAASPSHATVNFFFVHISPQHKISSACKSKSVGSIFNT